MANLRDDIRDYINSFYEPICDELMGLRLMSEEEYIPVIRRDTEMFLRTVLESKRPKKILEIGTAIGYSAMYFSRICKDAEIYSIEKDEEILEIAKKNMASFDNSGRIHFMLGDGQEQCDKLFDMGISDFDFVLIDAAKSHYRRFFDAAVRVCANNAIIISDDIWQRGVTVSEKYDCKAKHRTNGRRMNEFLSFLTHCPYLHTTLLDIGDGLALSVYKGNTCKE